MRVVVDTDLLVRGAMSRGPRGAPLNRLGQPGFELIYSRQLLEELIEVLNRSKFRERYRVTDARRDALLASITRFGIRVEPNRAISVCRDPDDDKLLEAAVASQADAIVTTDHDLLALNPFEGIRIVTPLVLVAMLDLN